VFTIIEQYKGDDYNIFLNAVIAYRMAAHVMGNVWDDD